MRYWDKPELCDQESQNTFNNPEDHLRLGRPATRKIDLSQTPTLPSPMGDIKGRLKEVSKKPKIRVKDFSKCPRCGAATEQSIAYSGAPSEFWRNCTRCNTYINTYIPQKHQYAFHKEYGRFKGNFGGFGTGKTLTDRQEFYKHMFITPKGNGLISANIMAQYEQTIKRDIDADIPQAFVADESIQKSYYDFINGYRLLFRPMDDPDKLRSLNLDFAIMLEASEIKEEGYTVIKHRLRNNAAAIQAKDEEGKPLYKPGKNGQPIPVYKANWRQAIIESNPDNGWIKHEHLLHSSKVFTFGDVQHKYDDIPPHEQNPSIVSFVTASGENEFLPDNFIQDLMKNKPLWWVQRMVFGSFEFAEGLVYPEAQQYIVESFAPPREWKRIVAFDYGLSDDAVFLFGALDPARNILYFYREVRTRNKNVQDLAAMFKQASSDVPVGGWITQPIIDPKSGVKRDYDKKSLIGHFLEHGINFQPGYINLDARIFRTGTYFKTGRIRIMNCCSGVIDEFKKYKFAAANNTTSGLSGKPEDKNNHGINCVEWICMELPSDPNQMTARVFDGLGRNAALNTQRQVGGWALSDDNDYAYDSPNFGFKL